MSQQILGIEKKKICEVGNLNVSLGKKTHLQLTL